MPRSWNVLSTLYWIVMTTEEIVIKVYTASIGKTSTLSYFLLNDVRGLNDISSTVTMDFRAQQVWSLCREKTSEYRKTIRRKHFNAPQDLLVKSPRLADTCAKVEEVEEHWKENQRRSAFPGRWVGGGRGGMGKRFLCVCLSLILWNCQVTSMEKMPNALLFLPQLLLL